MRNTNIELGGNFNFQSSYFPSAAFDTKIIIFVNNTKTWKLPCNKL